jgi:hypothetical protein
MATFAKLNSENIVEQVISVHNNELLDNGIESEQKGINFCKSLFGQDTNWKQTSYNTRAGKHYTNNILSIDQSNAFRKNHAARGYTYDENRDAFIPPKSFNSWVLNENSCIWEAPVQCPGELINYMWNEQTLSWELVDNS